MPTYTESIVINAPQKKVLEVLKDFENYPKFQEEICDLDVQKKAAKSAQVYFAVKVAGQKIEYTLHFKFENPEHITWKMVEGSSLLKKNEGSWTLEPVSPAKTKATFSVETSFAFWVPNSIAEGVIKTHMPKMLKAFKKRAEKGSA